MKKIIMLFVLSLLMGLMGFSNIANANTICTDSDNGKDYYINGTTKNAEGISYTDYCKDNSTLIEFFCSSADSNEISYEEFMCLNGCKNSICFYQKITDINGNKQTYNPKEKINLKIKGIEIDGNPASYDNGWNVQYYTYNTSNPNDYLQEYIPSGNYNAKYSNGYWYADYWTPLTGGNYFTEIMLYCSTEGSKCWNIYGQHGPQWRSQWRERIYFSSGAETGSCAKENESLGAVVSGNNKQCCAGLKPYIASGIIGIRGICKKIIDDQQNNTNVLDLAVINMEIPNKATLGSDISVKATIKDLNLSNVPLYTVTTSVIDSENNYIVVDEKNYNGSAINEQGMIYKFNIPASKFKLGENTIIVQVEDPSGKEIELENNSFDKSINIVKKANVKLPYRDGAILISKTSNRAYFIKNKTKHYISTLKEFKEHKKKSKIYRVSDAVLNLYPDEQNNSNVLFINEDTNQTYFIKNKTKHYISTLQELKKYSGSQRYKVDDAVLDLYKDVK